MKVVVAPNSFKETLSARQFIDIVEEEGGVFDVVGFPLSDGGDGFLDCVPGDIIDVETFGPLGEKIVAQIKKKDRRVYIESAAVLGLRLVEKEERDPLKTSSRGLGLLMKKAVDLGAKEIVVGMGGSSTVDFGIGALKELGFGFLGKDGKDVPENALGISMLDRIIKKNLIADIKQIHICCTCDVENSGPDVVIYAPQKGASKKTIGLIKQGVEQIRKIFGSDVLTIKHGGAAGGIPLFFKLLLDAQLVSGAEFLVNESGLEESLADADLVITGEGKIDDQTRFGKIPYLVAEMAKKHDIPVVALVGEAGKLSPEIESYFTAILSIAPGPINRDTLMVRTKKELARTVRQVFRLLTVMSQGGICH